MKKKLLVTGGGTGGHVLAGLAVADAWRALFGESADLLFVGASGGIEEKLVPRGGYRLETLRLGSLNRVGWKKRLKTAIQLPWAMLSALRILLEFRPEYVLGVGGYASGPVVLMARVLGTFRILRVRVGILEQNSVPGMTNRILSRFAHLVFLAFPGTESQFPGKHTLMTGNPIRSIMKPLPSAVRDPFTIFVFGGSQGAIGINTLVLAALPHLKDIQHRLHWIHQTGIRDFDRVAQGYREFGIPARVEKFIDDMSAAYAASSLLVCRAGSSSLAEIAAVRRAAVLVPLPTAADNHQEKNARIFVQRDAARILLQGQAQGVDLANDIRELCARPAAISEMEVSVGQFYRPQAAEEVAQSLHSCNLKSIRG